MKVETRTPLVLLTGFLGAGKTTWLKEILAGESYGASAVLVNEFGEVGIDHLLVNAISPDVILLESGCVCCQIRGELKSAVLELLTLRANGTIPAFKRVIIETTGLSDPVQIFSTFLNDPILKNQTILSDVIVIVDVLNGRSLHAKQPEWIAQVSAASLLLLSKTDMVTPEHEHAMCGYLSKINPLAPIQKVQEKIQWSDLAASFAPHKYVNPSQHIAHEGVHGSAATLALCIEKQVNWVAFVVWLSSLIYLHGNKLLRVKCLLNTQKNGALLLDGVGHTLHKPTHLEEWPGDDKRSRIVFIARDLDLKVLEQSFNSFVKTHNV